MQDTGSWAEEQFSRCNLGDPRRVRRLIEIGTQLANQVGASLSSSCNGDESRLEGSYRFIRNEAIKAYAISEGAFKATVEAARNYETLLALEDGTTVGYSHAVSSTLGDLGGPEGSASAGFQVQNVLLVAAGERRTVGLLEQRIWLREKEKRGVKHRRRQRAYEEKESYKWEESSKRIAVRMGEQMEKVISVCDREADIYEYLHYKLSHGERFVVRCRHDRKTALSSSMLSELELTKVLGKYEVAVMQRSGRRARQVKVHVRSGRVAIEAPRGKSELGKLEVNVVMASESASGRDEKDKLCWILLTSEPIDSFEAAREVTKYYEARWHIEEYHKAWKSGVGAEEQQMQSEGNLARMLAILGVVAVRLLQLREALETRGSEKDKPPPCTQVLTQTEWKILWLFMNKGAKKKKPPARACDLTWAYCAVAKLGGFSNSKRTGVASWATIWHGWFRLQERVAGYEARQWKL